MAVTHRPYAGEEDYQRIRSLLIDAFSPEGFGTWCTAGDLDWRRFTEDDPAAFGATHLWEDGSDGVVAFAWPSGDEMTLVIHPAHRALDAMLVEWAESHRLAPQPTGERPARLEIWAFDDDPLAEILEQRGYQRSGDSMIDLRRSIMAPVSTPTLPAGYRVRHVAGEEDVERRVAVHRDAFAPSRMTVAKHRAVMASPSYRPGLDLVIEAPDGSFAAFAIVWHDPVNQMGVFEPVGCHSAHRRRGLGWAIMQEGLRRLAELGATTAFVGAEATNPASTALYASTGFEPFKTSHAWEKRWL